MMEMLVQFIQELRQISRLGCQTTNSGSVSYPLVAAFHLIFRSKLKSFYGTLELIDAGLSVVGCLKTLE